MTFYDILGVDRHATQEEIRTAYRKLARENHPDSMQGAQPEVQAQAEENIKALNAAFRTLGDPTRRRSYHDVMWTRHDPARKYRYRNKKTGRKYRENGAAHRTDPTANLILELQQLRVDQQNLGQRQANRRRRLWFSAGFTSLIVFFLISFRIGLEGAVDQFGLVLIFFAGVEIITLNIIINAAGMGEVRGARFSSPVFFAISVFVGSFMLCGTTLLSDYTQSTGPSLFSGIVISAALGIHLLAATRLARIQEDIFKAEQKGYADRIRQLEMKLAQMNGRRGGKHGR